MKTEGTFEYDSLIAGAEPVKMMVFPVVSTVEKADLQRGLLLSWQSGEGGGLTPLLIGDTSGEPATATEASVPFAILAEDLAEAGEEAEIDSAPVYVGGAFNKDAVIAKSGELDNDTVAAYAKIGIRLISVAK